MLLRFSPLIDSTRLEMPGNRGGGGGGGDDRLLSCMCHIGMAF